MPCVSSPRGKTAAAPTGRQDCSFGQWHKGRVLESDSERAWAPQGELPRSSTPAPAEPTAAPHHCSLLQLLTPDPAWSAQCNTRHLILEAAGGCEKLSLQSETVLTYWKISFSSKLCMFVPVLCSLPGFLFFRSTTPPFPVAGLLLSRLFLTFFCLWWTWQSYSETHPAANNFLAHDGWFLLSWRRKCWKIIYTRPSFHRAFCLIAKLFPNPPSSSPCPAQRLHVQTPLGWWSQGRNLWNVARIKAEWQLKMVTWGQPGEAVVGWRLPMPSTHWVPDPGSKSVEQKRSLCSCT